MSNLKRWSKGLFSKTKVELHMALEVTLRLDVAQETRALSNEERDLKILISR
jgi:hypothetical protein